MLVATLVPGLPSLAVDRLQGGGAVRHGGAEEEVPAGARARRPHRRLLPHRSGQRLRRRCTPIPSRLPSPVLDLDRTTNRLRTLQRLSARFGAHHQLASSNHRLSFSRTHCTNTLQNTEYARAH